MLDNLRWLMVVLRVKLYADGMLYAYRQIFYDALRPPNQNGSAFIAYPDAFFHLTEMDLDRARAAVRAVRKAAVLGKS